MEEADIHHNQPPTTTFTYILPFIQTFLANKGLTEYHIHISTTTHFKQAFYDNTQTEFITVVNDFVALHYKNDVFYQGKAFDKDYNCDYIFIHVKSEGGEHIVSRMVQDLTKQYDNEWTKHRVPNLFSIVQQDLSTNPIYFARSISHFQESNGFEVTQHIIDIYFDHLSIHSLKH
jgi:hypothetical protein